MPVSPAVVALFYSGTLHWGYLLATAVTLGSLLLLNRSGVYRALPYGLLGAVLWGCLHAGGRHATLAGVLLALFVPTRPPPKLKALVAQANAIVQAEAERGAQALRHSPSLPALIGVALLWRPGPASSGDVLACPRATHL